MPQSLSIFDPASLQAATIRNLSFLVLTITGFIFLLVEGVLIYVTVRCSELVYITPAGRGPESVAEFVAGSGEERP